MDRIVIALALTPAYQPSKERKVAFRFCPSFSLKQRQLVLHIVLGNVIGNPINIVGSYYFTRLLIPHVPDQRSRR